MLLGVLLGVATVGSVWCMTLTEFLLARIGEDEAAAHRMADAVWPEEVAVVPSMDTGEAAPDEPQGCVSVGPQYAPKAYARVWNPHQIDGRILGADNFDHGWSYHDSASVVWGPAAAARVLAECEAKRRMVKFATSRFQIREGVEEPWDGWVLRELAAVYADHPDYRNEWKP
jgi:hypothetical protein